MNTSSNSPVRHYLYNPQLLDDEDLEKGFIVRTEIFDSLIKDIEATRESSPPPHHLIIGQRGMGKSTLLRRIGLELRRDPLNKRFVPLNFPEEQHVEVDRLSKFYLNCLDSLADCLEAEENHEASEKLDELIGNLTDAGGSEEALEHDTRHAFREQAKKLDRRPGPLIDNFHLLLDRLSEHDHQLRGFFSEPGAPILVGAATTMPEQGKDHGKAFYDGFKPRVLHRLSLDEVRNIIRRLADGNERVLNRLSASLPHLAALRDLTGGNPRTAHLLYNLFASEFSDDVFENLQGLIDGITPLYQSYLDQLSEQGQIIAGVLAHGQKPMTAQAITEEGGLKRASVSPQLGRLEDIGFVERVPLYGTKKEGYQIAERFFNIWYLLRIPSRRDRSRLSLLSRFLKDLYSLEELTSGARQLLCHQSLDEIQLQVALSLSGAIDDCTLARDLKAKAELELVEKMAGIHERIAEILDPDEIESRVYEFAELKECLRRMVPKGASITPIEFVDLVISNPALLPGSNSFWDRDRIASSKIHDYQHFRKLVTGLRRHHKAFEKELVDNNKRDPAITCQDYESICEKIRIGRLQSWTDEKGLDDLLSEELAETVSRLFFAVTSDEAKNKVGYDLVDKLLRNQLPPTEIDEMWPDCYIDLLQFNWPLGQKRLLEWRLDSNSEDSKAWNELGNLSYEKLHEYDNAEKCFRKSIETDPAFPAPWNGAGNLLTYLGRFTEAEDAYLKSTEIDPEYAYAWNGLGCLYHEHLARFEAAEESFKKSIEFSPDYVPPKYGLANLYRLQFGFYTEAEELFRESIRISPDNAYPRNGLGNLLWDDLNRTKEALEAFKGAVGCDPNFDAARLNMASILRDNFGRFKESNAILEEITHWDEWQDSHALHRTLFAAYDDNWGLATQSLRDALDASGRRLSPRTRDDWFRAAAVLLHLGFGEKLQTFLDEEKLDEAMLPFVEAIRAHVEGDRNYLRNIAAEARPGEKIFDEIERRRQYLPESTRR